MEVNKHKGKRTLLAFLARRKCYERVHHAVAAERSIGSGMPRGLANLAMDMHGGQRHVNAHRAVAQPKTGNHGLVAGSAFVEDMLNASWRTFKGKCDDGRLRDYMAEIALQVDDAIAEGCATRTRHVLVEMQDTLIQGDLGLNDANHQVRTRPYERRQGC